MTERIQIGGLQVAKVLSDLVNDKIAPGTGIEPAKFWAELEAILVDLAPKNRQLLQKRDDCRPAIGCPGNECTLCAKCGQCPLGQLV